MNLASRVTSAAMAGQILFTEEVAKEAAEAGIPVEEVGSRLLRGVEQVTVLYRTSVEESRTDPTCGKEVTSPPAAWITRDDGEYWFCSEGCLRDFLVGDAGT
ncbi:MAG: hypothetical protein ABR579_11070 [Actinomycetota bacterium]